MKLFENRWNRTFLLAGIASLVYMSFSFRPSSAAKPAGGVMTLSAMAAIDEKLALYDSLDLEALGLKREAFVYALKGFKNLLIQGKIHKDNLLSILDFSLPSGKKRFFVIDLESEELVFHTYASHGKKSGTAIPTQFSNKTNSNKSSLGFYVTGDTYQGKHGQSLRLLGEENGINNNAMKRGIVMHSASYVDEQIIAQQGFIGRSQGCPAIPKDVSKEVIEKIKNGSCLFIYSPDKYYVSHSKMIREKA
ncbi:MAG: hypothetical protein RLZZ28_2599 [Bacteroidota bacterium]